MPLCLETDLISLNFHSIAMICWQGLCLVNLMLVMQRLASLCPLLQHYLPSHTEGWLWRTRGPDVSVPFDPITTHIGSFTEHVCVCVLDASGKPVQCWKWSEPSAVSHQDICEDISILFLLKAMFLYRITDDKDTIRPSFLSPFFLTLPVLSPVHLCVSYNTTEVGARFL